MIGKERGKQGKRSRVTGKQKKRSSEHSIKIKILNVTISFQKKKRQIIAVMIIIISQRTENNDNLPGNTNLAGCKQRNENGKRNTNTQELPLKPSNPRPSPPKKKKRNE